MRQIEKYDYCWEDLVILSAALDALNDIKFLLAKANSLNGEELQIKLNYQFLGNCLKKLNLASIKSDPELEALILWARAENTNKSRHLFDRMDTAHETNFLRLIDPKNSLTKSKARWLQECQTLTDLIETRLAYYDFKVPKKPKAAHDDFSLDISLLPQYRSDTEIERCLGNICHALAIINNLNVNADVLPTLSNIAVILAANQVIGNNINALSELEYTFGEAATGVRKQIVENRNCIAHAVLFSSFITQPRYFYNRYVKRCLALEEVVRPLAEPLFIAAAPADNNSAAYNAGAAATPLEEDDNSTVPVPSYYQAHLELFQHLKDANIIAQDKEPELDSQGRLFSDTELQYVLAELMGKNNFELFSKILDNLKSYTATKAKSLINTPIEYTRTENKKLIVPKGLELEAITRLSRSFVPTSVEEKKSLEKLIIASGIRQGVESRSTMLRNFNKKNLPVEVGTTCKSIIIYSSDKRSTYVHNDFSILSDEDMQYPPLRSVYLLEFSIMHMSENPEGADCHFLQKLLDTGANPNIEVGTRYGTDSLLWMAFSNGAFPAMNLLIAYGANINTRSRREGNALWVEMAKFSPSPWVNHLLRRMIDTFGVDPRIYCISNTISVNSKIKSHLACLIVSADLDDEETCQRLCAVIFPMASMYGFESIADMLMSSVFVPASDQTGRKNLNRHRNSVQVSKPKQVLYAMRSFIDTVTSICTDLYSKPKCKELIGLLIALNKSKNCELFKTVLTNNLEAVQNFLESKPTPEQLALLREKLICNKSNKKSEIGLGMFAKLFYCDQEIQDYLFNHIKHLLKLKAQAKETSEGKEDGDNEPTTHTSQQLPLPILRFTPSKEATEQPNSSSLDQMENPSTPLPSSLLDKGESSVLISAAAIPISIGDCSKQDVGLMASTALTNEGNCNRNPIEYNVKLIAPDDSLAKPHVRNI